MRKRETKTKLMKSHPEKSPRWSTCRCKRFIQMHLGDWNWWSWL